MFSHHNDKVSVEDFESKKNSDVFPDFLMDINVGAKIHFDWIDLLFHFHQRWLSIEDNKSCFFLNQMFDVEIYQRGE